MKKLQLVVADGRSHIHIPDKINDASYFFFTNPRLKLELFNKLFIHDSRWQFIPVPDMFQEIRCHLTAKVAMISLIVIKPPDSFYKIQRIIPRFGDHWYWALLPSHFKKCV